MGKKYYQDRKKGMKGGFVTGNDPSVGRSDHAGMPKETVMSSYPENSMRKGAYLDDSMSEIDAIQKDSNYQVESKLSHQK